MRNWLHCPPHVASWVCLAVRPPGGLAGYAIGYFFYDTIGARIVEFYGYAGKFEEVGFERGVSCGVVYYHPGRDLALVVHGDDFTFCGVDADLDWIQDLMSTWFEVKVRARLGPDRDDDKEVTILGRRVRWTEKGIEYEADPKHRMMVLDAFGLQ